MSDITDLDLPLAQSLAHQAKHSPDAPIYLYVDTNDKEVQISYLQLYNAARRTAQLLASDCKPDDVVGVIGNVDTLLHQSVVLGLCTAKAVVRCDSRPSPPSIIRSIDNDNLLLLLAIPDVTAPSTGCHYSPFEVDQFP